jgi:hypothetical protein
MSLSIRVVAGDFETVSNQHVWPLELTVLGPDLVSGLPAEIFVIDILPDGDQVSEVFACVADVADLSNIDTIPDTDGVTINPSYRTDSIRLDFLSAAEREDCWNNKIKPDIGSLIANWEASLDMTGEEVVVVTAADQNPYSLGVL